MKWTNLRLLGALLAMILIAAACGSSTETIDIADTADADNDAMSDDAMEDMDDADHDDHGDDHDDDHGDDHDDDHAHAAVLNVDRAEPIPGVAIEVRATDTAGLFDIAVTLENFTIDEANVDGEPAANTGHMHLLVDGVKVERFFELDHFVELGPGEYVVEVELNANDHTPWGVDGARINATQLVEVMGDTESGDVVIEAALANGTVAVDSDRVEIPLGSTVEIRVTADAMEHVHLHGYDIMANVAPESGAVIAFTADTPGKFEVEFEESGIFIVELVVS